MPLPRAGDDARDRSAGTETTPSRATPTGTTTAPATHPDRGPTSAGSAGTETTSRGVTPAGTTTAPATPPADADPVAAGSARGGLAGGSERAAGRGNGGSVAAANGHSATTAAATTAAALAAAAAAAEWTAGGARRTGTLGTEADNATAPPDPMRPAAMPRLTGEPGGGGSGALWAGRQTDPFVDSGSVGLRMFNLGTIPASVTPPRSWRRAAWFTVAASMAALAGLVVLGALLVGPTQERGQTTALPYFPDGKPLATLGSPTSTNTQPGLRPPLPSSGSLPNNDPNGYPNATRTATQATGAIRSPTSATSARCAAPRSVQARRPVFRRTRARTPAHPWSRRRRASRP